MTPANRHLTSLLASCFGLSLRWFTVVELADGMVRLTPTLDVEGFGGRVFERGLLPAHTESDDFLLLTMTRTDPQVAAS